MTCRPSQLDCRTTMRRWKPTRWGSVLVLMLAVAAAAGQAPTLPEPPEPPDPHFCSTLENLVEAAGDAFRGVRGAVQHASLGVWAARVSIPGGSVCRVFDGPLPIYGCMLYAGDDDEAADLAFHGTAAQAVACLGSTWTSREFATGDYAHITVTRPGPGPVVRLTSHLSDADAYEVQLWIDGP